MDDILKLFENISVKPSAIKEGESTKSISAFTDVNALCDAMDDSNSLGKNAADAEWELFQDTCNKLNYLEEYFSNDPEVPPESLGVYLQGIDRQTIHYLRDITWDLECFEETEIKELLECSLSIYDPVEKLECMNEAYSKMVLLLEEHDRFSILKEPEDTLFLNLFPKKRKRT